MAAPIRVLHVTAHLGGGVGRVLSQVTRRRREAGSAFADEFLLLEEPRDGRFADLIRATGAPLLVAPSAAETAELVGRADIIQLEWWHHPLLCRWMAEHEGLRARLVVWAHSSGLHYPAIPPAFAALPHAFLPTTAATLSRLRPTGDTILAVVNSSGGFDDLPRRRHWGEPARFGYLGSLNPAKLHPRVTDFLEAVPGLTVEFHGDASVNPGLGASPAVRLRGHTDRPAEALLGMDVFVYLLNPTHYGSTENALLEAMACGAVPVVLDNPAEAAIVRQDETGLVVDSPASFAEAITRLAADPALRRRLGEAAAEEVRERYSLENTTRLLDGIHGAVMDLDKRAFAFSPIFGEGPADWFLSCLGEYRRCFEDGAARDERLALPFLYERSKSSAFQFRDHFPADSRLARWCALLESDLA